MPEMIVSQATSYATKEIRATLPDGTELTIYADGDVCVREGSTEYTFTLPTVGDVAKACSVAGRPESGEVTLSLPVVHRH